jgi:hypothetical protein
MIDLHTHSTFSDGTVTPADLLRSAADAGLEAVALTDHDTVRGVQALAGAEPPLPFVPGIEMSIQYREDLRFHMLGLFVDPMRPEAMEFERFNQEKRHERNRAIVEKLTALGYPMEYEEVMAKAQGIVGRMHIARTLVEKGYFSTVGEVFAAVMNRGKPAYVARFRYPAPQGVAFIHALGGLAVLAHIGKELDDREEMRAILKDLKEKGLDGVESHHADHAPELREWLAALAKDLGLATSGGSDFHGANKPSVDLGRGRGDLKVGFEVYLRLKERWEKRQA